MRHRLILIICIFFPALVIAQQSCDDLVSPGIRHVTITSATSITTPPDYYPPRNPGPFGTTPDLKVSKPFCRIVGYSTPVQNSHIGFEIWLPPAENWNKRFLAVGNPGFIGSISYGGLAGALERGYATASTDTGHREPGYAWASGHPDKLMDWSYRAVHEMTVVAKRLIETFYGEPQRYAYWNSCHNGGREGLAEAQRYPQDYDGIVAGDPAWYITRLQAGSEYISWISLKDGVEAPGYIPPAKYPVLNRAAIDTCDALDGVTDGMIEDATRCRFDPAAIQCPGADAASCLTPAQVDTARHIYAGAKFTDGSQVYAGFEPGSELGWGIMAAGPNPLGISNGFFQNMVFEDPAWDYHTFDLDNDTRLADARIGHIVNSIDPDLTTFKANGGKLIVYQSWNETAVPPRGIIDYYNRVIDANDGINTTQDFFRLFVVPGMGICPGFSNPGAFNPLEAMQQWRENGVVPDQITATYFNQRRAYKTHPVCPYPQAAIYKGSGDTKDAVNFTCGTPSW